MGRLRTEPVPGTGARRSDWGPALAAGGVASWAINAATTPIYHRQSRASRRRERLAHPETTPEHVARRFWHLAGVDPSPRQVGALTKVGHYGLGGLGGPAYVWLRRSRGVRPLPAAAGIGLAFTVFDEVGLPLARLTRRPTAYPAVTHLRSLVGHVAYAAALAAVVETAWRLTRTAPPAPAASVEADAERPAAPEPALVG